MHYAGDAAIVESITRPGAEIHGYEPTPGDIVRAQEKIWFIALQPFGAALFTLGGIAAAHRTPFDLPESENDLVGGYITEYTGMSFGLFFLGEYLAILLVSAFAVTLSARNGRQLRSSSTATSGDNRPSASTVPGMA